MDIQSRENNVVNSDIIKLIDQYFGTEWGNEEGVDLKILNNRLYHLLRHMLEKDFSGLMNAMYRIDIAEDQFKEAMSSDGLDAIAQELSSLVFLRIKEKASFREKWRKSVDLS